MLKNKLPRRLRETLYVFIHSPNYIGLSLRPDSYLGGALYYFFVCIVHPYEYFMRRFYLKKYVEQPTNIISKKEGYYVDSHANSETVNAAIEHCREIIKRKNWDDVNDPQHKSFLLQYWFEPGDACHNKIWKLAVDPLIISPIVEYLGYVPLLGSALLWYSPNNNFESGRSQEFHLDGDNNKQVKVFVFLDDIDEQSGPLTIIPAEQSKIAFKKMKIKSLVERRNNKVNDKTMYQFCNKEDEVVFLGKKGCIGFVDTDSCYHFGSRPGNKKRLILQLQYISQAGSHQATFNRNIDLRVKELLKDDPNNLVNEYILGFTHLAHPKTKNIG